jgi:hypothetical protein
VAPAGQPSAADVVMESARKDPETVTPEDSRTSGGAHRPERAAGLPGTADAMRYMYYRAHVFHPRAMTKNRDQAIIKK